MANLHTPSTTEPRDGTSLKHHLQEDDVKQTDCILPSNYPNLLVSLHAKVIVRENPVIGRGFVASGSIAAGDTILEEKPVALCLYESPVAGGFQMCHICLKIFKLTGPHEKSNGEYYYCTKHCLEQGRKAKHGWKIAELEALGSSNLLLLANMLITRPNLEQLQSVVSNVENREYEDMMNALPRVLQILELENEKGIFEIAKHYVGVVFVNSFGVRFNVINKDDFGMALYEKASFFNHSCDPNCYAVWDESTICVRTLRDITPGEPLTIAFMTFVEMQKTSVRKTVLSSVFGFNCCCKKCEHPPAAETTLLDEHPMVARLNKFATRSWENGDVNTAFKFYSKMFEKERFWLPKFSKSIESLNDIVERALAEDAVAVVEVGRKAARIGATLCEEVVANELCSNLTLYQITFMLYDMILCLVCINLDRTQETMMKNLEEICQLRERIRDLTNSMNLDLRSFCGDIPHNRLCSALEFFEQVAHAE